MFATVITPASTGLSAASFQWRGKFASRSGRGWHRQRCQSGDVGTSVERPYRVDQRRDVVPGIPIGGGLAQLLLEIAVAHRIDIAATRRHLRRPVRLAVGGGDI